MSKNSVRLTVFGTECVVGTDDSEAYVRSIAAEVQDCMQALSRQNETASGSVIAIVAALSFCDDYHKANKSTETLREQSKGYLEDSTKARLEAEEARKETARLQQEVASLRARLSETESDGPADSTIDAPVQRSACTGSFSRPTREAGEESGEFLHYFEEEEKENEEAKDE